ncbi:MAG: TaqI-like C-terminal specificity domain-containing protein, partial [Spirochaetota bacterium]
MDYCSDITRHAAYIKRRTDLLSCHLDAFSDRDTVIYGFMLAILTGKTPQATLPSDCIEALQELHSLLDIWDIQKDGDLAGYLYQRIESSSSKKSKGQFFTPQGIVTYLIEKAIPEDTELETIRILDPACGSGQFLIAAFRRLANLYEKKGIPFHEAAYYIVTRNLFGSDIDEIAVMAARYNLSILSGVPAEKIHSIYKLNYLITDTLFSSSEYSRTDFDIIIGNPPWGSHLNPEEKKYYRKIFESANSGVNSFTLVMERSLQILSDGGTLAFLIPEAYLNIKAHWSSRMLMLNTTKLKEITRWGEQFKKVFAPAMTIIAQKCSDENARKENIIQIRSAEQISSGTSMLIPQHYFHTTYQNIFNINYSHRAVSLINRISDSDCVFLEKNARFFLGIVTGNNEEHLSLHQDDIYRDPIIIGKDLEQYKVNFSGHYFHYNPDNLQQVAPQQYYTAKNKILYRFIGRKLTFAIDYDGYYSLNNVNGFIPGIDGCPPEYLTALLNSSVMQYYYDKNFFTLKVLKGNLEKLPLKLCCNQDMTKISDLSRTAALTYDDAERSKCKALIDDM